MSDGLRDENRKTCLNNEKKLKKKKRGNKVQYFYNMFGNMYMFDNYKIYTPNQKSRILNLLRTKR